MACELKVYTPLNIVLVNKLINKMCDHKLNFIFLNKNAYFASSQNVVLRLMDKKVFTFSCYKIRLSGPVYVRTT